VPTSSHTCLDHIGTSASYPDFKPTCSLAAPAHPPRRPASAEACCPHRPPRRRFIRRTHPSFPFEQPNSKEAIKKGWRAEVLPATDEIGVSDNFHLRLILSRKKDDKRSIEDADGQLDSPWTAPNITVWLKAPNPGFAFFLFSSLQIFPPAPISATSLIKTPFATYSQ